MNVLSRSFLLSFIAYLRVFLLLLGNEKLKFSKLFLAKFLFLIIVILFLSIYFTTKLRNTQFYDSGKTAISTPLASTFSEIFSLSVNRWVGIDALLAVSESKNLSFNFFLSALNEKRNIKKKSFYIENFFSRFNHSKFEKENLNIVITPGIVAFLYYNYYINLTRY